MVDTYAPPRVVKAAAGRELRVRLGRHVDRATSALTQAYAAAWQQTLDRLLEAVANAEAEALSIGSAGPAAFRTVKLQQSLDELTRLLRDLNAQAGVTVNGVVPPIIAIPPQVTGSAIALTGARARPVQAYELQAMVQRTSSKIASDYMALTRDAEEALRTALVRGVTEGKGPRDVAAHMVDAARVVAADRHGLTVEQVDDLRRHGVAESIVGEVRGAFAGGQARALNLARTELIDASRRSTTASYVAAGVVTGWRWLSALDSRTCPACWGMHNTIHPVTAHQDGHQQCRCTQVPILDGEDDADSDLGDPDELLRQALRSGTRRQRDDLRVGFGAARLQHIADGGSVRDLVVRRTTPGWRPSYVVKRVRDLTV